MHTEMTPGLASSSAQPPNAFDNHRRPSFLGVEYDGIRRYPTVYIIAHRFCHPEATVTEFDYF